MNDMPKISQEMIKIYDDYTHLTLDRRNFMQKLTKLAGSTAAAAAIVPMLEASKARAAIVAEDDAAPEGGDDHLSRRRGRHDERLSGDAGGRLRPAARP